jgi:hypothetical protein
MCCRGGTRTLEINQQDVQRGKAMDNTPRRTRPLVALVVASVIGAGVGMSAATAFATPGARTAGDLGSCDRTPMIVHSRTDPDMPPSDFLRGAGRTAPVPH